MSGHELLEIIRKRPFEPFRIQMSDGVIYDITHPELVMPGFTIAVVGVPADPSQPLIRVSHTITLSHITRLIPLAAPVSG
jgi:hypothetical protein